MAANNVFHRPTTAHRHCELGLTAIPVYSRMLAGQASGSATGCGRCGGGVSGVGLPWFPYIPTWSNSLSGEGDSFL